MIKLGEKKNNIAINYTTGSVGSEYYITIKYNKLICLTAFRVTFVLYMLRIFTTILLESSCLYMVAKPLAMQVLVCKNTAQFDASRISITMV